MKQSRDIIIAIVGIAIIGIVISYFYSADLTKNQGLAFGNDLKSIQDELITQQTQFSSKYTVLNENAISTEEFLDFSNTHIKKMDEFILFSKPCVNVLNCDDIKSIVFKVCLKSLEIIERFPNCSLE